MPTKADLLSKLDENCLKTIAKSEGYPVPKTFGKRELVKYLDGLLTLEKIKEYTAEVYEKETKREIIKETIKERGIKVKVKESEKVEISKPQLINEVISSKAKVDKAVIEELATYLHEPMPKGSGYNLYNNMNEKMLEMVHRIFIKNESDGKGRFLEFQFANFLMKHTKADVARLKIRYTLDKVGEIDVLGFDSDDHPVVFAECKDRPVKYEDMDKWLSNIRRMHSEYEGSLEEAYFVGSSGYTDGTIKRVEDLKEIDAKKGCVKTVDIVSQIFTFATSNKDFAKSGGVFFEIYDVRQNQFVKILPRN